MASLQSVDIKPTVAVEVEEGHSAGHGFGKLMFVASSVVEVEREAPRVAFVEEPGDD